VEPRTILDILGKGKYFIQPENEPGGLGLPTHVLFIIPVQLFHLNIASHQI